MTNLPGMTGHEEVNRLEHKHKAIGNEQNQLAAIEGIVRDVTERVNAERRVKVTCEKLQALSARLQDIQEEERRRVARELHDEVGQQLTMVKLDLELITHELPGSFSERLKRSIDLVDQCFKHVRSVAVSLRPPVLDDMGLVEAVNTMINNMRTRTGIDIKVIIEGKEQRLGKEIEVSLYRCIQEALTNVLRHSRATVCTVVIDFRSTDVIVTVSDNGIGFSFDALEPNLARVGLIGMQERVRTLGGRLLITCHPQQGGTKINIIIPKR